jgi:hypothetical protein
VVVSNIFFKIHLISLFIYFIHFIKFIIRLLNIASPLLYIPLGTFFTSMFFGSIPYNLACCQAGDILSELSSTADIWQPTLLLKMILVSLLSLLPPLYTKNCKKSQNNTKLTFNEQLLVSETDQVVVII